MALDTQHNDTASAARAVADVDLRSAHRGGAQILGAVRLTVQPSETVALTGPSGVGKTTLLRIIAGLEAGYDGMVRGPEAIAMVFQEPTLLRWRTIRDNLMIPLGIARSEAEAALAQVGLAGRGGDFPGQLSLGQQRRLALARAFAGSPDLLLMDEPFVSLDAGLADEMMGLFETLRAARPVATILVTHAQSEAERLATRIVRMEGRPATLTGAA